MARKVRLNSRGIAEVAKSREMREVIEDLANRVADAAKAQGVQVEGIPGDKQLPVEVSVYETDRARASVMLAHPAGLATQAKHGTLTRAAASVGLEVRGS